LCYFHLHIQGWNKHVRKFIADNALAKAKAEQVRLWIRDWFFTLESEKEYLHSQAELRTYLQAWHDEQPDEDTNNCIIAINRYIEKNLKPYEIMWLNWRRLDVYGFGERTTSIGEAMHWSMKSGYNGVRPSMNADTAAICMMDKAQEKGREKGVRNLAQVNSTPTHTDSETSKQLTKDAEKGAQWEWDQRQWYKVFEVSSGVYLVLTPGKSSCEQSRIVYSD
jgi:hypothetical protein